ncbi:hypothetical protein HYPSUDRAFT_403284 [Hypholoma sublateritium FD-334 SS-4]|uniref:Uncharacterized protein n=1 Tax=Hypholoma sublateritium (strain FD-334 SS-4) TaxID=945553 RepID=A0A0D2P3M2_HYPSF|nr:hypothetical protein HYPSUDRAFT_403284 [Hypholoma sublateritium FD-334 SS-4]
MPRASANVRPDLYVERLPFSSVMYFSGSPNPLKSLSYHCNPYSFAADLASRYIFTSRVLPSCRSKAAFLGGIQSHVMSSFITQGQRLRMINIAQDTVPRSESQRHCATPTGPELFKKQHPRAMLDAVRPKHQLQTTTRQSKKCTTRPRIPKPRRRFLSPTPCTNLFTDHRTTQRLAQPLAPPTPRAGAAHPTPSPYSSVKINPPAKQTHASATRADSAPAGNLEI